MILRVRCACIYLYLQSSGPRFLNYGNCTANFMWETGAACAISTADDKNKVSCCIPHQLEANVYL